MPSPHQSSSNTETFDTEPEKMVATKTDATLAAIIRGIHDVDRARRYVEAEIDVADREGRDPRREVIANLNQRIAAIQSDADRAEN